MTHSPRQQLLRIGQHERQIGGLAGAIDQLVGVANEIKEECRQSGKMNIFVPLVADHRQAALLRLEVERRLRAEVAKITKIVFPVNLAPPVRRRAPGNEGRKRSAIELRRDVEVEKIKH